MSDAYKGYVLWQDWLSKWWMASRRPANGRPGATYRARYREDVIAVLDEAERAGCGTTCDCDVARAPCKRPPVQLGILRTYTP